jgi:hypothetical protein
MKNKNKSAKVQKFVQTVKQQEAMAGKSPDVVSGQSLYGLCKRL